MTTIPNFAEVPLAYGAPKGRDVVAQAEGLGQPGKKRL